MQEVFLYKFLDCMAGVLGSYDGVVDLSAAGCTDTPWT